MWRNKMKKQNKLDKSLEIKERICEKLSEQKNYNRIYKHLDIAEKILDGYKSAIKQMILNIYTNEQIDIVMNRKIALKDAIIEVENQLNQVKTEL